MKKVLSVFVGVLAAAFILAGCSDLLNKPADGRGTLTIHIGGGKNARTLLPDEFGDFYYVLTFTPQPAGESFDHTMGKQASVSLQLLPGDWKVDVKGFISGADAGDESKAAAAGSSGIFSVESGEDTSVTIKVTVIADRLPQSGSGTLALSVSYPSGTSGDFKVLTLNETDAEPPITLAAGTKTEDEITLPAGSYHVAVRAVFGGKEKVWRELAHIYDGLVTRAEKTFTAADFAASSAAKITGFDTGGEARDAVIWDGSAEIIDIIAPGADLTSIALDITFEGAMITPASGEPRDFSNPVTYTVYTESGEKKEYTVTITNIPSVERLEQYLDCFPPNNAEHPLPGVKVKIDLDNGGWESVLDELGSSGRYVELDLSESTGMEPFDPGIADTGENFIVSLTLPDTTTAIRGLTNVTDTTPSVFQHFTSLIKIKGDGIIMVGAGAFKGTRNAPNEFLAQFDFPNLVTIERYAFAFCDALETVTIEDKIEKIDQYVFRGCGNLTEASIFGSSKTLAQAGLFYQCLKLKNVYINVPKIQLWTFNNCSELHTVTIGDQVSEIVGAAFSGCTKLTTVIFEGTKNVSVLANAFPNSLHSVYSGPGTYTRPNETATDWTKQP